MDSSIGWLLDVTIEQNCATLWIKTTDGKILRLRDSYQPNFYVLPKNENTGTELFHLLSHQPKIKKVEWQDRCTNLFDHYGYEMKRLICVYPESIYHYKVLSKKLQNDMRVAQLLNADLSHIQQYLFTRLKVEPTSKVEVQYDKDSLINLAKLDEFEVQPPPFSVLYFEVITSSSQYSLDSNNIIRRINARYQQEPKITFEGAEEKLLKDFCKYVLDINPDILVSPKEHYRSTGILHYLSARMSELGIGLEVGRNNQTNKKNSIEGRIYLEINSIQNIVEIIEKSQFACVTPGLAASYGISRVIDSRNCYELLNRGFVISQSSNRQEPIRTVEEIVIKDKGGMIFSPRVGLHENVAVLDYENEYANLILKHNLSYEGCIDTKGLLPTVLETVLKRRIMFKNLQKSFPVNSREWLWCEQRIVALKNILVALYGTTGSFWNRYANVATFEEINRLSREILLKTKDIVQGLGFELVYADTDSVFIKKNGATLEDFECVKETLAKETGLAITLENCYKFLVLLPLEADEKMEALKHYFGITTRNELIARGIEIRRHDAPNFIKEFQSEVLYTLFDCKDSAEIISKGYEDVLLLVTKTIDKVMTGELELKDLIVSKILRQDLYKYKSLFPHVSAALQLTEAGVPLTRGETIQYIYTDAAHSNALRRVMPVDFIEEGSEKVYDKEKYRDMLLEAAETVLGYFGFDRTLFGGTSRSKNRKWWYQLREQRQKEIDIEKSSNI
ncbi:MAG: DNA polymerase domain-containing protein [Candidatus Nitrosopolaris sp.]|jgi:DNA polymerase elongation subunit (family B)